jgi:hypothetical protein
MARKVRACSGIANRSPAAGACPPGMKAGAKPGCEASVPIAAAHCRAIVGETAKPSRAYPIAGSKSAANGSRPNRSDNATHAETPPGTVTDSQPTAGI